MILTLKKTKLECEFISWMVRNRFLYRLDTHYKEHGGYRFVLPVRRGRESVKLFIDRSVLLVDDVSLLAPLKRHIEQQLFADFGYVFKHD